MLDSTFGTEFATSSSHGASLQSDTMTLLLSERLGDTRLSSRLL